MFVITHKDFELSLTDTCIIRKQPIIFGIAENRTRNDWVRSTNCIHDTILFLQVIIGMMASLITLPPAILLIFIFRKSRVRKLRPSRVDQALKEKKQPVEAQLQAGVVVQAHDETLNVDSGHGNDRDTIILCSPLKP
jgi:predicted membrane protein